MVDAEDLFCSEEVGAEFKLFREPLKFSDAVAACVEEGAGLTRICGRLEFSAITALGILTNTNNTLTYIGLYAENGTEGVNYEFVDGYTDSTFWATDGVFPWKGKEPNHESEGCVALSILPRSNNI